jgi:nucleoside-diphosphate-sugar epimerase
MAGMRSTQLPGWRAPVETDVIATPNEPTAMTTLRSDPTASADARRTTATGADERPAVLVLGAGGRIGAACVRAFAQAGWRVLAQARRPLPDLPADAVALAVDLADTDALVRAAAGARAVVHAVNPPYTEWDASLLPLARLGMDAAERLGARFMLPGNVYNFGRGMPPLLAEDTPMRPDTTKGRQRVALEDEMAARPGLRSVVIRAGDFFGAGEGSWLDLAIAKSIARGRLVYPGPLDRVHAWAYLPDLARAFVAVAERDGDLPRVERLHFEGHAPTGAELLASIERAAARLGLSPARGWRHGGMPWPLLRIAGLVVPMLRELSRMAYLWSVPHRLDGTRLARRVGALPATPLDDAMVAALQALGHGAAPRSSGTPSASAA